MLTRRAFLQTIGLVALATPLLQACGGATAGPAATAAAQAAALQVSASVAATTAAGTTAAAASTTGAPASSAAAQVAGKTNLSIAVWTIPGRSWQKDYAQKYAAMHPEINLKIDEIVYDDMAKKQLAEVATGTLQDLVFSGIKWNAYSAFKGAFRPIDDLVRQKDPGMSDFFPDAVAGATFEGKLYALPFEVNPGNVNVIVFNQDLLDKKGVKPPTDDWTIDDFAQMAAKLTDRAAKVFGTDMFFGSYYDFGTLARSLGGDDISADGKNYTMNTDPKSIEAAHWAVDLAVKYKASPSRTETQGIAFPAGQVALHADGVQSVISLAKTIGNKFKWDAVLGPTGPNGLRGRDGFVTMYNMSAKTKEPQAAYDLQMFMTSKDTATAAMANQGQPSARQSVWASPEVTQVNAIFSRAGKWIADPKDKGPFPLPYNLRFSELQDKFANLSPALFYGEIPFDDGMKKVQDACQQIMALPRS